MPHLEITVQIKSVRNRHLKPAVFLEKRTGKRHLKPLQIFLEKKNKLTFSFTSQLFSHLAPGFCWVNRVEYDIYAV